MARIENVNIDGTNYDVGKIATSSSLGVVQIGSGLSINGAGVLSATGGAPVSLTLSYNTTEWSPNTMLQGMYVLYDFNSASGLYISSMDLSGASLVFTNDATSSTVSIDGVFNMLESGTDVVLNNVPIGYYKDASTAIALPDPVMSGVRFSAYGDSSFQAGGSTVYMKFHTGTALALSNNFAIPFGFALARFRVEGESDEYQFLVQGLSYQSPPT